MEALATLDILEEEKRKHIDDVIQKEGPRLLGFIKKRIPSMDDAEDILQDVVVNFAESFLLPEPIQQSTSWLYRVAKNKIADLFRKKKPESFGALLPEEESWIDSMFLDTSDAHDELWNQNLSEAIQNAINHLPKAQQDVFVWHEIEGLSFQQIQAKVHQPIPTLISRKRYAIKALQKELRSLYQDFKEY